MTIIHPSTLRDLSFVMAHLRPVDEREIGCQIPDGTPRHEAAYGLLMAGDAFTAWLGDDPVACFGSTPMTGVCRSAWAFGTKRMRRAVPAITAYLRDRYAPDLMAAGMRTIEARSHVDHVEAHRWVHLLGAVAADLPYEYGKNGEKFVTWRWTADDFPSMPQARRTR